MIDKSDLRRVSYEEYGLIMNRLTAAIQAAKVRYDVIVPILRGGAVTATHLAYKLSIANMLPVQYKYLADSDVRLMQKFPFPDLQYDLPPQPNILVVDTNTVKGTVATIVISDVKQSYPDAAVDFATVCLDQSHVDVPLARNMYYERLTNERRLLTAQAAAAAHISQQILVFPWENLQEQWHEIQALLQSRG